MFGSSEVLVAAKQLLQIEGFEQTDTSEVEYFHLLFDEHEIVRSNGAETESLYTGPQALRAVGEAARDEIPTLLPQLRDTLRGCPSLGSLARGRGNWRSVTPEMERI